MARILLIDDEELVVHSLEKFLRKLGHCIVSARNGIEAIRQVEEQDFDLIITDIRMPKLNGIDMITQIRELLRQKGRPHIPEICITGYADDELVKKAEAMGVADYLYKPFELTDFMNCVNKNLKQISSGEIK